MSEKLPDKSSCAHAEYIRSCGECPWFHLDPSDAEYACQHHEAPADLRAKYWITPPPTCPIRGGVALFVIGRPNVMPGTCRCGKPTKYDNGWCGECSWEAKVRET